MTNQELDAPVRYWGMPHRAAIIVASICTVFGLVAYLLYLIGSFLGGYGGHVALPPIKNHDSLRMMLSRTSCFGTCPDYSVEIRGDGTVIYEGNSCVVTQGHHDGHILESRVDELLERFKSAEFLSLKDHYLAAATDLPTFTVSLKYDAVSKTVTDYGGNLMGMPGAMTDLENAIDDFAEITVWVYGPDRSCGGWPLPTQ
jgi:hypothetical protein